ncbi:MAG TPA: PH domain-containing protein [Acidimicrobiales bacterium]|nr:PH domain-containing protein [Acidimicrobiales bacterium]
MPFPRKLLNEGEDIVLDIHPHWWFFTGPVAVLALTVVGAVVAREIDVLRVALILGCLASLLWLGWRYARWATTNFTITTDRLIFREGVLAKRGKEIPLERLNDIAVSQSVFERLLGAGDLTTESGGERGQQVFADIPKPFLVQNVIYTEMERSGARDAARAAGHRELSIPEQIEKLDELRQRGIISRAEFEAKKTQLLDRM